MNTYTPAQIQEILTKHHFWLEGKGGGERADFTGANLTWANLTGADFTRARFCRAFGNGREIKSMQLGTYSITYTAEVLQIGCEQYPIVQWWDFTDEQIHEMNGQKALDWWHKWKPLLRQIIETSPATPTGKEKS